ncbi:ferredoxin-type protein NapG [Campylobacter geochelonis]|uniref:Quinol dehydrogenase periplasmic component n=1 Tax=Campylobacter geochelonis TaxID=1780362 RepID=A0A128EF64_9BACT|nr:ferredoxin-type protein NapG [Campylobacter geochelonis]QKF71764.1 menaquinol dehydrogenase NapGH, periplasmic component NapG [Campylobacter geochelonis]CZE47564.1 quinol dehydrogenase periplasmic component [Campylobacter geochelonis]CZE48491.1 quinol dehydrogenase periplasmic component [Campylobacter geochelonis]CZE51182.1 quinol dehydrogenase periplasmic component [Campylobacter geochelonis]
MTRRELLKSGFKVISIALAGGFVWKMASKNDYKVFLRPPGALDEAKFSSKCIKCALCVKACPYDTLKLAKFGDNMTVGTPYFTPREIPCYMCEDIPCVPACPTGALDSSLVSKDDKLDANSIRVGVAVVDMQNCVAYWGIQCDACYRACPLLDKAIYLEYKRNDRTAKHAFLLPVVDAAFCTGCGKCEHACITKKAAIFVLPREVALGEVGDNYVKGWEKDGDSKLQNADTSVKLQEKKAINYLNSEEF